MPTKTLPSFTHHILALFNLKVDILSYTDLEDFFRHQLSFI